MKIIDRRKFIKELKAAGFVFIRQTGSHEIYKKGNKLISVPIHLNPCIAIRLQKEIAKER